MKLAASPSQLAQSPRPPAGARFLLECACALLLVGACDDDGGGSGYQQSCRRTCVRAHDCLSSIDADQCTDDCIGGLSEVGDHLRRDYVVGIDMCIAELSCDQLVIATASQMCRDESSARLAPSQAAISLCDAVSASFKECLGLTVGTAGCIDSVKIFDDQALKSALTCVKEECSQRASCLEERLGISLSGA